MAEQIENTCGCTDCNRDVKAAKTGTDDIRAAYGKAVASAAINEMHSNTEEGKLTLVDDAEVTAFINACAESNEDVIMVVKHIAKREGIDLMTNDVPKEADKARLWSFLISVLKTVAFNLAKAAAQMILSGELDWREVLGLFAKRGDSNGKMAGKGDASKPDHSHVGCYVIRRNGCATLGYAFSW